MRFESATVRRATVHYDGPTASCGTVHHSTLRTSHHRTGPSHYRIIGPRTAWLAITRSSPN